MADGLLDFLSTPEGQGLLSATFGGLAGARRGAGPLNTIGMAGMSGLNGYSNAQDQQQRLKSASLANTMTQMQVDQMKRQQAQQDYIEQAAQGAYKPPMTADQNAMAAVAKMGGQVGPTVQAANLAPSSQATPGGMDNAALISSIAAKYPMVALDMAQKAKQAGRITLKKDDIVYDENTGKPIYSNPVPDLQYVPGTGYKPDLIFDKNSGKIISPGATGNGSPSMQPNPTGQPDMSGGAPPQGSPNVPRAPWAGMPPEQADQFKKSVYEQESKKLQDLQDSVSKGRKTLAALDRFGELNRQTGTGGLLDKWTSDNLTFDPNKQEMISIQSALAPTMRAPGSGSSSDTDVRLMKSGLPSTDKDGSVNRAIRENYRNQLNSDEQELAFKQRYLEQYGHLNGADQAFQQAMKGGPAAGAPAQSQANPAPAQVTPSAKMLNAEQRAALDIIVKSGNPQLLDSARKKGWIK